jgi:hypothetical protein
MYKKRYLFGVGDQEEAHVSTHDIISLIVMLQHKKGFSSQQDVFTYKYEVQ